MGILRRWEFKNVAPGWEGKYFDLGKGDSPSPPDYSPLANASKESAEIMANLGREQLAESKRQYDSNSAVAKQVVDAQLGIMRDTNEQGQDYYDYMKGTFRPVEEGLVKDAVDFSTAGAREQFSRDAVADLERAQSGEQAQSERAMASMGVNPNSGRFAGMQRAQTIMNAGTRAGVATNARERADALGFAKRMDVVGIGRNLPGASTASYQVATGAGNSAVGNQMAPGGQLLNGMAQGASITGQGLSMQNQGLATIAGMQTNSYNAGLSDNSGGIGSVLGAAGAVASMGGSGGFGWWSSKKLKTDKQPIDAEVITKGLQKIPVEAWRYKEGAGDEGEHIGPYAEDVHREFGNTAAPGGKMVDPITLTGLAIASAKDSADRLDRIEKKLGMTRR